MVEGIWTILITVWAVFTLILLVARFELGLLLLIPILPTLGYSYRTPIIGLNTTNLLVYTAFAMGLLRRMGHREKGLPPATLPFLTFFLITLFAWLLGYLNFRSEGYETFRWLKNIERWVLYTLLYFAYYFGWSGKIRPIIAFRWLFVGVMMVEGSSLMEIVHPSRYYVASGRAGGFFQQANSTGIFLASYGLLSIALMSLSRSVFTKIFYLGCFGLCIAGIAISASRASFVSLVAASLVYAFYASRRMFALLLIGFIVVVPAYRIFLPKVVSERIERTFAGSKYEGVAGKFEGSAANRIVQNIAVLKAFEESPILGHGLGGFYYRSPRWLPPTHLRVARAAHSTFVWALAETGAVGLVALVWFLGSVALEGLRLYQNSDIQEERLMGLFLLTSMIAKSIANFFNTEFLTGDVSAYLWVSAGLVAWMNLQRKAHAAAEARQTIKSTWRPQARAPARSAAHRG